MIGVAQPPSAVNPAWASVAKPAEAVAANLNDYESTVKLVFSVGRENLREFPMNRIEGRGGQPEVYNPGAELLDEHKAAEVAVPCDENPALTLGGGHEVRVRGLR